ncbi:MAG: DNA double-strand break repair nuclease NurA [Thaumarchaeota archaeon]|nr:DNA double-strand break repair nuclease NurA [Nitrososphaerota archaeon]
MPNQLSIVPQRAISDNLVDLESLTSDLDTSLSTLTGMKVFFRTDYSKESVPLENLESFPKPCPYPIRNFSQRTRDRKIIAVDSSCALIGETEEGSIFAGRVAVVSASKSKIITYYRAGPFVYYLTMKYLSEELRGSLPSRTLRAIASDNTFAERYIRIRLERHAQILAAKTNTDSIILVDGSIRSSALETRVLSLRELERVAESNSNSLLGVGKTSCLRIVSTAANLLQSVGSSGNYFDISEFVRIFSPNIESRVLVARFSHNSRVFRVDASRINPEDDAQVLSDLKQNDLLFRGYPETLRLAHHLAVFDSSTISSTRSYLSKKYRLVHIPSDDVRATILGKLV